EPGLTQRQVLVVGARDQGVQHRILEHRPPFGQVIRFLANADVTAIDPVLGHWRRSTLLIAPDLEAVIDLLVEGSATANRQYDLPQCGQAKPRRQQTPQQASPSTGETLHTTPVLPTPRRVRGTWLHPRVSRECPCLPLRRTGKGQARPFSPAISAE